MFVETEYKIPNLENIIYDTDVSESGAWVCITHKKNNSQQILFNGISLKPPKVLSFPLIRIIDYEHILIVNSRTQPKTENAWIINFDGNIKTTFFAGDAIEDIVVTKDFIVVTYFDESLGSADIESQRISFFDLYGKYLFGYRDAIGNEYICDCYAATYIKKNQFIFFPYTDFPIVLVDLDNKSQKVWKTPEVVKGSHAISKRGNKIYFHNSYKDRYSIYEWKIGREEAKKVCESKFELRGLPNGRFLTLENTGYKIISIE